MKRQGMKKLVIALIALVITLAASAQEQKVDSLEYRIQTDLLRFNKEHNVGNGFILAGVAITGIGLASYSPGLQNQGFAYGLVLTGSLLSITGVIIHLDSYKFLGGRASLTVYPNGAKIIF